MMKFYKTVCVEQEVEICLDRDELDGLLGAILANSSDVLDLLNNIAKFLQAVTDEQISQMSPKHAELCADFFCAQVRRFGAQAATATENMATKRRLAWEEIAKNLIDFQNGQTTT